MRRRRLSLRTQVILLSAVVLAVLGLVVVVLASALRSSESAVAGAEQRRIAGTAYALARAYATHPSWARAASTDSLPAAADAVVGREPGVAGGWYFVTGNRLVDAPAAPGPPVPGPPDAGSGRRRPRTRVGPPADVADVAAIARGAALLGRDSSAVLRRPKDLIVVFATPLRALPNTGTPATRAAGARPGSAWATVRVPGFRADQRRQTGWAGLALAAAALGCGLLALGIARGVRRGVTTVARGLAALEHDLGTRVETAGEPAEIAELGDGVNRLADGLRRQMAEARAAEERLRHAERLAALGRLTAGVAHEVRNPLATMRLRAQLLQAAPDADAADRRALGVIVAEADRLNALVERLLTLSRPTPARVTPADVGAVVAGRLDAYAARAAAAGVHLVPPVHLPNDRDDLWAAVEADALAQIVDNVVQNAIEAMEPDGGTLTAAITRLTAPATPREAGEIAVEVRDTGPGPSDEAERHAFDPFFTTKPRGTGLGLAISYELVRAHGGTLRLARGDGPADRPGAVVTLTLPAAEVPDVVRADVLRTAA